jgi:glycosyltransferase involved in cell wall biosynthesis
MRGVPPRVSQQLDADPLAEVASRLAPADLIVAGTVFSLPYVPDELLARTVLDAHNVESNVVRQLARNAPRHRRWAYSATARWTEAWERRAARSLREVWAVSREECEWFRSAGARSVCLVPNGVHAPKERPLRTGQDVAFVASFASMFNVQAFHWFVSEVWPLVLAEHPVARLLLAGRGSSGLTGPRVEALGFVEDLDEVYTRSRLTIAPLRSGAGTRLKVLEGLANGLPVVSTTLGAEGLDLVPDQHYLVADSPVEFAEAIIRLITDDNEWSRLAEEGFQAVSARYDWRNIESVVADRTRALTGMGAQDSGDLDLTIALPTYNAEQHLAQALESVLNQTRTVSQVHAFDNASTDRTRKVASGLLPASHVHSSPENIGAAANFNRSVEAASTEYFAWLAADDELEPSFAERCVRLLEASPEAALCFPGVSFIDVEGQTTRTQIDLALASSSTRERLRSYVGRRRWTEVYAVYRTRELQRSPGFAPGFAPDVRLVWWFLLRGPATASSTPLLRYREEYVKTPHEMAASLAPRGAPTSENGRKVRMWRDLWRETDDPDVSPRVRRIARQELLRCLVFPNAWRHLLEDVRTWKARPH